MSKQSEAKRAQGYVAKAIPQTCGNCAHFQFERVNVNADRPQYEEYWEDKNLRCGIGGFAVKKMGTCDEWVGNKEPTT